MGCSASLQNRKVSSDLPVHRGSNSIALSPKQKKAIQSTWYLLKPKKNELGVQIFLSLFNTTPSLQQVFPEFRNMTLETLKTNKSLHGHTKRVMKVVENAVSALDDTESMNEYLQELGRRHRYRQIKPKPIHLEEISNCIKITFMMFLGSQWTTDVAESWNIFLDSVMNLIKEGPHHSNDSIILLLNLLTLGSISPKQICCASLSKSLRKIRYFFRNGQPCSITCRKVHNKVTWTDCGAILCRSIEIIQSVRAVD